MFEVFALASHLGFVTTDGIKECEKDRNSGPSCTIKAVLLVKGTTGNSNKNRPNR